MNPTSPRRRIGLILAGVLLATSVPGVALPTPEGDVGPPFAVLALGSVLGVVGLVAVLRAWRGHQGALRVAAGCIIIGTLTALPAFFVDVPLGLRLATAIGVLVSILAVVLMFSPTHRPVPVTD